MAPPKRARMEAGSSSAPLDDVVFDPHRFLSAIAESEYEKLKKKSIIKERGFKPTPDDGELMNMIEERGWQVICEEPAPVPVRIVQEFYANAKVEKNGYSYVRGTVVDYRPKAIRKVLRQPPQPQGVEDWAMKTREEVDLDNIVTELCMPGTVWKYSPGTNDHLTFLAKTMNRYARAWNLFICANLIPSSHTHEVTVERAILLWGIVTGEYVDLGFLLHQGMLWSMQGGTTGAIPHASIVARLCAAVGITWGAEEHVQDPMGPIDHSIVRRMVEWTGGIAHHRGLGYIIEGHGGAEDDEEQGGEHVDEPLPPPRQQRGARRVRVPRAGTSRVRPAMTSSQHRRLTRRVDTMYDMITRFTTDMGEALDEMGRAQGYEGNWPTFGAHHTYPPPDSPPEEGDDASD